MSLMHIRPLHLAAMLALVSGSWAIAHAGKTKSKSSSPKTRLENKLLGQHRFGVQFIWDGYGEATITRTPEGLEIKGKQLAKEKRASKDQPRDKLALVGDGSAPRKADPRERDYVRIRGIIKVLNPKTLQVTGTLTTFIKSCCGFQELEGTFTFRKWGKRKYYRLQDPWRGKLCHKYTCHYYIDLFD